MRLSALVVVAILLSPAPALAQRGGGGHAGGGFSGSASSGSSHGSPGSAGSSRGSGIASSSSVSTSRRSNSSSAESARSSSERSSSERSSSFSERSPKDPANTGLNIRPNLLKSSVTEKADAQPEKKGFFSFLHHKKPAPGLASLTNPPSRCKKGQSCRIRPACQTGRAWNSSSCAQYDQYSWFDACRSLADRLAAERERMRLGGDPGASLRYQMMQNQYRQCMARYGAEPFSSYLFSDASFVPYF